MVASCEGPRLPGPRSAAAPIWEGFDLACSHPTFDEVFVVEASSLGCHLFGIIGIGPGGASVDGQWVPADVIEPAITWTAVSPDDPAGWGSPGVDGSASTSP